MLNKKERKINHLEATNMGFSPTYYYWVKAEYKAASTLTIYCNGSINGVYYDNIKVTMSKGSESSEYYTVEVICNGAGNCYSTGTALSEILSISPSEDDTYIYTF